MDAAYTASAWQPLWTTVAACAASLLGLLFVAISINLRAVVHEPADAARARESLGLLLVLLILGVVGLIPGQGRAVLGIELAVLGAGLVGGSVILQGQTLRRLAPARRSGWLARNLGFNLGTLAVPVAGGSLIAGHGGGLLWLVPTVLIYFLWSSANAWSLITAAGRSPDPEPPRTDGRETSPPRTADGGSPARRDP